ncbi:MAG: mechanosensitive ion channel [Deltaproteobacteria bacterium]|nr:mechanosensitive ion channel [Deltaproteobacteria bacterium]
MSVALGAHLVVGVVRALGRRLLRSRVGSFTKLRTVTGFLSSVVVFSIYFGAIGFILAELGVALTTYLASASVIGLAVSFGSQGVVQDVITGLTVLSSDLLDVGDMVDIGGQIGIVDDVGMRFTTLVNFAGAQVFVPNRLINNVINYPKGYIRAYLDARLPEDPALQADAETRLTDIAQATYEQYPGILLLPPTVVGRLRLRGEREFLRVKFRIWPGQGALLEGAVKAAVIASLKQLDPQYADWMVTVYYRAEPQEPQSGKRLPRPGGLAEAELEPDAPPGEAGRG